MLDPRAVTQSSDCPGRRIDSCLTTKCDTRSYLCLEMKAILNSQKVVSSQETIRAMSTSTRQFTIVIAYKVCQLNPQCQIRPSLATQQRTYKTSIYFKRVILVSMRHHFSRLEATESSHSTRLRVCPAFIRVSNLVPKVAISQHRCGVKATKSTVIYSHELRHLLNASLLSNLKGS